MQVLGAARDSRPAGVVKRMYGDRPGRDLHWANLGLQQVPAGWGNIAQLSFIWT